MAYVDGSRSLLGASEESLGRVRGKRNIIARIVWNASVRPANKN